MKKYGILIIVALALLAANVTADNELDSATFGASVTVSNTAPSTSYTELDSATFGASVTVSNTAPSTSYTELDSATFGASATVSSTPANHAPSITINSPANGSTDVDVNVSINVTISDPDGDNMTITFWNWTGTEFMEWGHLSNKGNGTYEYKPYVGGFAYNTTYTWRASVSDGNITSNSETWTFTTAPSGVTPNQPPTANFTWSADGLTVTFTDTSNDSDGTIVNWTWNFGDNTLGYAKNPSHAYTEDGGYLVTLTVKDDNNATDSISKAVTVSTGGTGIIAIDDNTLVYVAIAAVVIVAALAIVAGGRKR